MAEADVWGFEAQTINGQRVKLSRYKGRVLLIVNTASQCGFTPQFDGLQALWQAYEDQGLVVLGFPSNEFGAQDPGSNDEIASFCQLNYGVSFPMMAKVEVNGAGAHPLYRWLASEAPGLLGSQAIKWNFTKFLVGRDGQVRQALRAAGRSVEAGGRHRGRVGGLMAAGQAGLAKLFVYFADHEVTADPLYQALCRHVAASPGLLALMEHAPPTQRVPNLLLASVHERVLAGVLHALREYFPSAGGRRAPDSDLAATFDDFVASQHDALCESLATRSTQTNEVGRCAVLWPALCALARRAGRPRLALFDFGSSAGLNLGVDSYRYDYGAFTLGAEDGDVPAIQCHVVGDAAALRRAAATAPQIVERCGVDPAPVDLHDDAQVRWLRACLWPYDAVRLARFDRAVAMARRSGFVVCRCDDCADAIEPWLDGLPADVLPVVFNSWVLHYFEPAAQAAHVAAHA